MKATELVSKRLLGFSDLLQTVTDSYYKSQYSSLKPPTIEIKEGSKYYQVWKRDADYVSHQARSIHAFINKINGDIYLPATWRAPAKIVSGNIFDKNYSIGKSVGMYGVVYIKSPLIGFDFEVE